MIDQRAIIHPSAKIADNVEIGPWSIIGPDVEIGEGSWIGSHVVIKQSTKIGHHNKIHPFASLGEDPQHLGYRGEETFLEIGDHNTIREYCTLNRGTPTGDHTTRIGNHNFLMSYAHIAHDCKVGNYVLLANNASLAGHVILGDHVIFSAFCASHQFCTVGPYAFLGRCAKIGQDIPAYVLVVGNPGAPHSINVVGLKRQGFSEETVQELRKAYKIVYRSGFKLEEALVKLEEMEKTCPEIRLFIDTIKSSKRGLAR